ncbi:hypothetical protein PV328_006135 [Microctonus aethiopoides]|uniref:ERAP1-like C-terminal domain-containing protein n=1 Tax=Microctonus aethiopoides TaxID=144406 RepID=A0AA39KT20_9HYME|nr:hypothetical protein PV328_006135 [Microctonus aethiopoides]
MISYILGEEKFKTGLRNYLKTKAFGSATSDDLFKEFAKVSADNLDLPKILKSWVTSPGYPVITVKRDYEAGKAIITQSQYLKEETDFIPWSVAWKAIEEIYRSIINTDFATDFKDFALKLSEKLEKEVLSIQYDEVDSIMKLKRADALRWTCKLGSSLCNSDAKIKLLNWLNNPETNALSAEEKDWIICAGLRNGDQKIWAKLIAKNIYYDRKIENGYSLNNFQADVSELGKKIRNKVQRDKLKTFIESNRASLKGALDQILADVDDNLKIIDDESHKFKELFTTNATHKPDTTIDIVPESPIKLTNEE